MYNIFWEIITWHPKTSTIDHPDFMACSSMEISIGLKRVEMVFKGVKPPRCVHTFKPTHKLAHIFTFRTFPVIAQNIELTFPSKLLF